MPTVHTGTCSSMMQPNLPKLIARGVAPDERELAFSVKYYR